MNPPAIRSKMDQREEGGLNKNKQILIVAISFMKNDAALIGRLIDWSTVHFETSSELRNLVCLFQGKIRLD